jgi:hypothetical protein
MEGQRRFCERHHRTMQTKDMAYAAEVLAYNTEPELMAAKAAYETLYVETRRLLNMSDYYTELNPAVHTARMRYEAAMYNARERLYPGIHDKEEAEDAEANAEAEAIFDEMRERAEIKEAEEWKDQEKKRMGRKSKSRV